MKLATKEMLVDTLVLGFSERGRVRLNAKSVSRQIVNAGIGLCREKSPAEIIEIIHDWLEKRWVSMREARLILDLIG